MLRLFFNIPSSGASPTPGASEEAAATVASAEELSDEAILEKEFGRSPQTIRDAALPRYDLYRHSVLRVRSCFLLVRGQIIS